MIFVIILLYFPHVINVTWAGILFIFIRESRIKHLPLHVSKFVKIMLITRNGSPDRLIGEMGLFGMAIIMVG